MHQLPYFPASPKLRPSLNHEDSSVGIPSPVDITDPFQQTYSRVILSKGDLTVTHSLPLELAILEDDLDEREK